MKNIIKKTSFFLITALFISCGSETTKEKNNEQNSNVVNTVEKNWEEFTINAVGNTMSDMKYDIKNISVKDGSWVRINLVNQGTDAAMLHNIVFVNFGSREEVAKACLDAGYQMNYVAKNKNIIAASDMAKPQETVILEFKAPNKGNYEFICTYPGHSGIMRGYFFVK